MRGERAYWCSRGKFYARAVFPPGESSAWVLLSTGENLYWYTFSGGDSIPGRFFRGEVLCGGKLYATTPAQIELFIALTSFLVQWHPQWSMVNSWVFCCIIFGDGDSVRMRSYHKLCCFNESRNNGTYRIIKTINYPYITSRKIAIVFIGRCSYD